PVTPATDLYALGVVLHELRTGKRPSEGRVIVDDHWRPVIERLLATAPSDRYQSARDVVAALEPRRRRWPYATAIAVVLAGGGAVAWKLRGDAPAEAPPITAGTAIAVAGFESPPDTAWIGTSLSEVFALELGGDKLRAIPPNKVATARLEVRSPNFDDAT